MLAMEDEELSALPDRLLAQLRLLDNEHGGFAVDRLTHSLQTAHRAEADGRDDSYLVCALVNDDRNRERVMAENGSTAVVRS